MIMRRLALPPPLPAVPGLLASLRRVSTAPAATRTLSVLSEEERRAKLEPLAARGWTFNPANESIEKTFRFTHFLRLWGFATQIAMETHRMNHHAQILVTSHNAVTIVFSTHHPKGLTAKDIKGAECCERAVSLSASLS